RDQPCRHNPLHSHTVTPLHVSGVLSCLAGVAVKLPDRIGVRRRRELSLGLDMEGDAPPGDVSEILRAWSEGDERALDRLTPIVYEELRRLARRYMRREKTGHSLQSAALVNEAYIRLVDYKRIRWQNRAHFFAISSQLMRR